MTTRDIESIRARIPLRYPYLMIDRIIEESADRVVAFKNVTINEPCFQGHFPEPLEAVFPGTLLLEAMAQTCAFLCAEDGTGQMGYLVGVDRFRIRRKVVPGDRVQIEARPARRKRQLVQAEARAMVEGAEVASATLSLLFPAG